jgi:hypothetical protein
MMYKTLYQEILTQLILDALGITTHPFYNKRFGTDQDKKDAQKWLKRHNQDFQFICQMAGLVPSYVLKKYKFLQSNKIKLNKLIKSYISRLDNYEKQRQIVRRYVSTSTIYVAAKSR